MIGTSQTAEATGIQRRGTSTTGSDGVGSTIARLVSLYRIPDQSGVER